MLVLAVELLIISITMASASICGTDLRTYETFSALANAQRLNPELNVAGIGRCVEKCAEKKLICGSDGRTYLNLCHLYLKKHHGAKVAPSHLGFCMVSDVPDSRRTPQTANITQKEDDAVVFPNQESETEAITPETIIITPSPKPFIPNPFSNATHFIYTFRHEVSVEEADLVEEPPVVTPELNVEPEIGANNATPAANYFIYRKSPFSFNPLQWVDNINIDNAVDVELSLEIPQALREVLNQNDGITNNKTLPKLPKDNKKKFPKNNKLWNFLIKTNKTRPKIPKDDKLLNFILPDDTSQSETDESEEEVTPADPNMHKIMRFQNDTDFVLDIPNIKHFTPYILAFRENERFALEYSPGTVTLFNGTDYIKIRKDNAPSAEINEDDD